MPSITGNIAKAINPVRHNDGPKGICIAPDLLFLIPEITKKHNNNPSIINPTVQAIRV